MGASSQGTKYFKSVHLKMVHEKIDVFFDRHKLALIERDLHRAKEYLNQFTASLVLHFDAEETFLFPIVQDRVQTLQAEIGTLTAEHETIKARLSIITDRVKEMTPKDDLQGLQELENDLRKMLIRHTEMEDLDIYPELDRVTTLAEKKELFKRVVL